MVEDSYQWPSTSDAMVSNPGMISINTRELRFPEKYNAFLSIEDKNQYIQNFNADYYHESRYQTQDQPIQRQVQNQVNQHAQNKRIQNHQRQQVQHQEVQNQGEASHQSYKLPPHSHCLQEETREVQESVVGIFLITKAPLLFSIPKNVVQNNCILLDLFIIEKAWNLF